MNVPALTTTLVAYAIDRNDVVVETGEGWDEFAVANGGAGDVLGRVLWDFVTGDDVRAVWQLLLREARGGHPVSFAFRCDAPFERRLMRMKLTPLADGGVAFLSRPLWTEAAAPEIPDGPVTVCGWCARVYLKRWLSAGEAVDRLGMATLSHPPQLTHGICPDCAADLRAL